MRILYVKCDEYYEELGWRVSAEHQKKVDRENSYRIPQKGSIIVYNEVDIGRTSNGFKLMERGCFRVLDTNVNNGAFVEVEDCIRQGVYRSRWIPVHDFLDEHFVWKEVKQEYYKQHVRCMDNSKVLSWDEFALVNFEDGEFIGDKEGGTKKAVNI